MKHNVGCLLLTILTLAAVVSSCTESDQALLQTAVAEAGQTAMAEGEQFAKTQVAELKETAVAAAKTQAVQLKETLQAGITTQASNIELTLIPQKFHEILMPAYAACLGKSTTVESPLAHSQEIIEKGFGRASFSCDESRGAINNTVLLFGGKSGNIIEPPDYEADVSSGIEFGLIPSFTGNLTVDVTLSVNSKTGAAAGSSLALVDFRDVILEILTSNQLGAFIDISESLILQTASGVKTDAYVYIDIEETRNEKTAVIGGRGFAASFPTPPNSQSAEFSSENVIVSIKVPVVEGEKIFIGAGIKTTARVHGWAVAYWNPSNKQEVFITSIELTEEK